MTICYLVYYTLGLQKYDFQTNSFNWQGDSIVMLSVLVTVRRQ